MPAISVSHVSKVYRLYDRPIDRLKETLSPSHRIYHRDFHALRDISFDIEKGSTAGIIGTNGSGKSTILKIITGVLSPTSGEVHTQGTISALLELGAGFNPDYTGIENIYMNGTMMGFEREEMDRRLPDILDFADIGDFVHQPVKTYSSGMFVRLAFALAINVEPDILIVDEALSVGDVFFQAKCYRRMEEIRQRGTTILMVTHDMGSVMKYCEHVILLNRGDMIAQGEPHAMVDLYKKILAGREVEEADIAAAGGTAGAVADGQAAAGTVQAFADAKTARTGTGTGTGKEAGTGTPGRKAKKQGTETETSVSAQSAGAAKTDAGRNAATGIASEMKSDKMPDGCKKTEGEPVPQDTDRPLKSFMNMNPGVTQYGDGRAQIYDFGILDAKGAPTTLILKGEEFTIREKIRFNAHIQAPIFTFTFKDKKGNDLTGTNTMYEGADVRPADAGDEYIAEFTQRMTLQGGEYLLSMSCTGFENGQHVVYHRMYDVISLTVISNKNTVGVYDMESEVRTQKIPAENVDIQR